METIEVVALANELNVRVKVLYDLASGGHFAIENGRIGSSTADELRWRLAMRKAELADSIE